MGAEKWKQVMLSTMDVSRNILISGPLFQQVDSDIFGPLEPPDMLVVIYTSVLFLVFGCLSMGLSFGVANYYRMISPFALYFVNIMELDTCDRSVQTHASRHPMHPALLD